MKAGRIKSEALYHVDMKSPRRAKPPLRGGAIRGPAEDIKARKPLSKKV